MEPNCYNVMWVQTSNIQTWSFVILCFFMWKKTITKDWMKSPISVNQSEMIPQTYKWNNIPAYYSSTNQCPSVDQNILSSCFLVQKPLLVPGILHRYILLRGYTQKTLLMHVHKWYVTICREKKNGLLNITTPVFNFNRSILINGKDSLKLILLSCNLRCLILIHKYVCFSQHSITSPLFHITNAHLREIKINDNTLCLEL